MAAPDPVLDDEELGAAFTGKKVMPGPTQSIMDPAPSGAGGFLSNPADQAALLQIGLGLMQPPGFGQTTLGHIGQAIGQGGEAADRGEAADLKQRQAESKLAIADERLRIAQQNADTRERRGLHGAVKGLTAYQQYRAGRDEAKDAAAAKKQEDDRLYDEAKSITDLVKNKQYENPDHPMVKQYGDKTLYQIQEDLRRQKAAAQGGGATAGGKYGAPGTKLRQGGKTYTVGPDGNPVED